MKAVEIPPCKGGGAHHWDIPKAQGVRSRGKCINCQLEWEFLNDPPVFKMTRPMDKEMQKARAIWYTLNALVWMETKE